jgi:bacteriorhodopsin
MFSEPVAHEVLPHMDFPWIAILFNFALLGVLLFICRTINAAQGKPIWNGALLFFTFCFVAMLLDFTLTMVFASASFHERTQYEVIASREAWSARILGYLIPCAVSLLLALRFRRRQRYARVRVSAPAGRETVTIQTSAYTQSELPL